MDTVLGHIIREEVKRQNLTIEEFAKRINTTRANAYHIFERESLDVDLLQRISQALHRNFFKEIAQETAAKLGDAPPAEMANMQLEGLISPVRDFFKGRRFFDAGEYTAERDKLKDVLREFFQSDHRLPLVIIETGYTFGAREVVKQIANEVFHVGSATCPKQIDAARIKAMPAKVLIDYIDRNTFDSVEESDKRLSEICLAATDTTKKMVCIVHIEPFVFQKDSTRTDSFDLWGCEYSMFASRSQQCLIVVYRWGRNSLLSWAKDAGLHEHVINYIAKHNVDNLASRDHQIEYGYTSFNYFPIMGEAIYQSLDYPTTKAYPQHVWEDASHYLTHRKEVKRPINGGELIEGIIRFNAGVPDFNQNFIEIGCDIEVDGFMVEGEILTIRQAQAGVLSFLTDLAKQTDLKGLDEETFDEKFYPWFEQRYPELAHELLEKAKSVLEEKLIFDDCDVIDGKTVWHYRDNIPHLPPSTADDGWTVMDDANFHLTFFGLPEWK